MKVETRYIAFDEAIFYSEKECTEYEKTHLMAGIQKVEFFDMCYKPIDTGDYGSLVELFDSSWVIKVHSVAEAKKIWAALIAYDGDTCRDSAVPFLDKEDNLVNEVLVFDGEFWTTIEEYFEDSFKMLNAVNYPPISLAGDYLSYREMHKDAE